MPPKVDWAPTPMSPSFFPFPSLFSSGGRLWRLERQPTITVSETSTNTLKDHELWTVTIWPPLACSHSSQLTFAIYAIQIFSQPSFTGSLQRWKWVIFRDPWPICDPSHSWPMTHMTHDPRSMVITPFHPMHGTRRGMAWWRWTTLSVLRTKKS